MKKLLILILANFALFGLLSTYAYADVYTGDAYSCQDVNNVIYTGNESFQNWYNNNCSSTPTPTPTPIPSETPTPTPTPTNTPSDPGTGGGDGLGCAVRDCSTHPAPATQAILGASTTKAVLGLSATSSDKGIKEIIFFAGSLLLTATGLVLLRKNA